MEKNKRLTASLTLALVCLANPNMNVIDILPDCISYFVLALLIGRAADIVPYLAECREALNKLTLITLIKIPAMAVMFANMRPGRDIIPLFTLTFTVLELIYLYSAISNGFRGMYYLGERSSASGFIGKHSDDIRLLTYIFVTAKAVLTVIPDFCLLSSADPYAVRRAAKIYPILSLISMGAVLIFGIIWLVNALKYVRAIRSGADISEAVVTLAGSERLAEIEKRSTIKRLTGLLSMLAASSLLTFDLVFEEFNGVNILPHFIYGIFMLFIIPRMTNDRKLIKLSFIGGGAYTAFSVVVQGLLIRFLDKYEYTVLEFSSDARAMYLPVWIFSILETAALLFFLLISWYILFGFIRSHTGVSPDSERYGRVDFDRHRTLSVKTAVMLALSALSAVIKTVDVIAKSKTTHDFADTSAEIIPDFPLPWLMTVAFFASVALVIYSFCFISELKNEVKLKYDDAASSEELENRGE